jgi:transposase
VAAVLARRLVRAPVSDVFGVRGRRWLAALELPLDERLTVDASLALDAVLTTQVTTAERMIATTLIEDARVRRLLTIPGIGLVTAAAILAVVGDITRFERPAKLVSYLGLDPRVRQSGDRPAMRGHISRAGQAHARGLLCEAAHAAIRAPAARTAFKQRELDRLAGRSRTRSSHRGATDESHDQGRARLRGGDDPHHPALRHAIDRVRQHGTPPSGA